jgi:hypothetical protein
VESSGVGLRQFLLVLACLCGSVSFAQDDDVFEEVTVYGDLFARWDNTRWFITTEVALPYALTLHREENLGFRTKMFQIRSVLACSKEWRLNRRHYEVDCEIEDIGLRATSWDRWRSFQFQNKKKAYKGIDKQESLEELEVEIPAGMGRDTVDYQDLDPMRNPMPYYGPKLRDLGVMDVECDVTLDVNANGKVAGAYVTACPGPFQEATAERLEAWRFKSLEQNVRTTLTIPFAVKVAKILAEADERLTGTKLQIQVSDDGQVQNVDIEGLEAHDQRTRRINETLRILLARMMAGFDMKLRKWNNLSEGQWVEYNPELMAMPTPDFVASRGSSILIHQLNKYRGERVVQSVGRGTISYGDGSNENFFSTRFNGVSIYDPEEGYMTERVWSLFGTPTASSAIADAGAGAPYWHAGRIRILGDGEVADVGPTEEVAMPGAPEAYLETGLKEWVAMEEIE